MEKKDKKKVERYSLTWTKQITRYLLIIGVLMAIVPYILAFCGKDPCESVAIAWITEIVAVAIGYFVRGFKDTRSEVQQKLEEMKLKHLIDMDTAECNENIEEPCGCDENEIIEEEQKDEC